MPRSVREPLILDVAGRVFAADGYERASMDRIAALADLSKPMLYAYFGSKEGLYSAYIQRTGGELVQRLVAADRTGSRADRIRAVTTEFLSFVQGQGDGWRVLFAEMTARRPLVELVARLRTQIVTEVRTMLEGGAQGRGLVPPASQGVAEAIVGAGEALANWWVEHPEVPLEDVADWYAGLTQAAISAAVPAAH
ncbi:MAG TPA: TetR/AcrR family transcriptional regulator [Solirubrobacteraceae bacterium]|nr:TetR/AcrR family transcriptional regulator [Solirubrobacteraceae bacterium]